MAREEKKTSFMNRWGVWLVWLVILVGIPVGGYALRQMQIDWEMNQVLHSDEVHQIIKDSLKRREINAFEPGGKIQTFEIDYSSRKLNPMGGLMFEVYINGDKSLEISYILIKNTLTNQYSITYATSVRFQEWIKEKTDD